MLNVVDDAYPDPAVAQWFAGLQDERVRYLRNDVNLGESMIVGRCRLRLGVADGTVDAEPVTSEHQQPRSVVGTRSRRQGVRFGRAPHRPRVNSREVPSSLA